VVRIEGDSFAPSPVVIESEEQDLRLTLRPAFDQLWQALGRQRSTLYDAEGRWVPPRDNQRE
jgi:hypothetical protein